ncbi:Hypothetical protein NTJ_01980 [Nesidiocoris tenuis]|uniref:Uncharacterized protein n=1 Tax=Nesidiocoris tenuis TaxID=355587 RepID=A0ABN7AA41_9HEMI|nr:Hypothetical protein NTJ_01980 [Nesidiocoris tenuis]
MPPLPPVRPVTAAFDIHEARTYRTAAHKSPSDVPRPTKYNRPAPLLFDCLPSPSDREPFHRSIALGRPHRILSCDGTSTFQP